MDEFTLDQLRAILEARWLARTFQIRMLSSEEESSLIRFAKIVANTDALLGDVESIVAGTSQAGPLDPLVGVPSESILDEMRSRQKAIYGEDDRVEIIASADAERRGRARSVAAIIARDSLIAVDGGLISIDGATLEDRYASAGKPLCVREPFRKQPSSAIGSAFLVAPTIVATANHCLSEATVGYRCLIFDFAIDASGAARTTFREDEIYGIRRYLAGSFSHKAEDWSLIELDRPVTDRQPLAVRTAGSAPDNLPLYVVGHPSGLPKKIAGNATIRVNSAPSHFVCNLDTYGGNSGSPVFNALTHEVEGILVRGDTDFVPLGNCYASLVCPITGCRGEDCSRIRPIAEFLAAHH